MTAASTFRLTDRSAPLPAMGTISSAANKLFYGGTMVSRDAAGRGDVPVDGQGFPVVGVAVATIDNRTGVGHGGAADAVDVDLLFGVFGFKFEDAAAVPGQVVYVVDNQTVSTDSDTGARGVAGVCVELREGLCWVFINPIGIGLFSDDSAVESDVLTLQGTVGNLETSALSAAARAAVPLSGFRLTADGAAVPAWADGSAAGFSVVGGEIVGIRWNPSQATSIATTLPLPADLDGAEDVTIEFTGFRIGASDTTLVLTVGAYMVAAGAAHDSDTNAGGNTAAFDGATNVLTTEPLVLASANVPEPPALLTLTVAPSAALDADDFVLTGVELVYTRKLLA